jgi:hypothetical protein
MGRTLGIGWVMVAACSHMHNSHAISPYCFSGVSELLIRSSITQDTFKPNENFRRQASEIFSNSEMSPLDQWKAYLKLFIDYRTQGTSKKLRERIYKQMESINPRATEDHHLHGRHYGFPTGFDGFVSVELPEAVINQGPDFFIRAHELEHVFQHLAIDEFLSSWAKLYFRTQHFVSAVVYPVGWLHYVRQRYLHEEGAISAEWFFLHHLPSHVIEKTIKVIQEIPAEGQGLNSRAFFLLTLKNAQKSRQEYLDFIRLEIKRDGAQKYTFKFFQFLTLTYFSTLPLGYGGLALFEAIIDDEKRLRSENPNSNRLLGFDKLEDHWILVRDLFNIYSVFHY